MDREKLKSPSKELSFSRTFVGNNSSNLAVHLNLGELKVFAGVISSSIHDFCSILIQ